MSDWRYPARTQVTPKQLAYLRSLAAERRIDLDRDLRLRWGCDPDDLDNVSASIAIDLAKAGGLLPMYRTERS